MEDRYDGILRPCDAGEDREVVSKVVAPPDENRGQRPETARYPRCGQQREEFAQDVASRATVPSSTLRSSEMKMLDSE